MGVGKQCRECDGRRITCEAGWSGWSSLPSKLMGTGHDILALGLAFFGVGRAWHSMALKWFTDVCEGSGAAIPLGSSHGWLNKLISNGRLDKEYLPSLGLRQCVVQM